VREAVLPSCACKPLVVFVLALKLRPWEQTLSKSEDGVGGAHEGGEERRADKRDEEIETNYK
jgi:hypothetical protein